MATQQCKRNLQAMEARRREGMRMLMRGSAQAAVARNLEVSRQTVSTWAKRLAEDPQAWRRRPLGKPGALTAADKSSLAKLLLDEPQYVDGSADPLTWSWERYSGRRFDRYELRRYAEGTDPEAAEVVATIDDVKQTTFREAALPAATSIYYVAVIAPDGSESGRSGEFKVSISVERS